MRDSTVYRQRFCCVTVNCGTLLTRSSGIYSHWIILQSSRSVSVESSLPVIQQNTANMYLMFME